MHSSRCAFAGSSSRRFGLESGEDPAGSADKLVRAAKQLPVNDFVYPVTALASSEAELALPRGGEEQATPIEAPAAEHAPHFQAVDGAKCVLGVDANLVFGLAHNGRLPATSAS
jgi:hypothetical protein